MVRKRRTFAEVVRAEHADGRGLVEEPFAHLDLMGYAVGSAEMPWLEALAALDAGNQVPLQELFLAGQVPPDQQIAIWVGEAMSRYQLTRVRKRGGQRKPAYAISPERLRLLVAMPKVRALIAAGKSPREASNAVAASDGIRESTLWHAHTGHHGGTYRAGVRRKTGRSP